MSKEAQKIWSRTNTSADVAGALRELRAARRHYAHLPKELRIRLDTQVGALSALHERIKAWPVTDDERAAAHFEKASRKAREAL